MRIALVAAALACLACSAPPPANRIDQIRAFVQAPGNEQASVLWLRALGVEALEAPCQGKFAEILHRPSTSEKEADCLFTVDGPFAEAVLVSRSAFEQLPEIRGLLDLEAVEAYVLWSERPERVGLKRSEAGIEIDADVAENNLILVRLPFADGWAVDEPARLERDPIGYVLLRPEQTGRRTFRLRRAAAAATSAPEWTAVEYPRIHPEGVVQPGQRYLVVYGENFTPGMTHALVDDQKIEAVFSSETQLNLQLPAEVAPGPHELQVETPAGRSHALTVDIQAEDRP